MVGRTDKELQGTDRRQFLRTGISTAAGIAILPKWLAAQTRSSQTPANAANLDEITLEALRSGIGRSALHVVHQLRNGLTFPDAIAALDKHARQHTDYGAANFRFRGGCEQAAKQFFAATT